MGTGLDSGQGAGDCGQRAAVCGVPDFLTRDGQFFVDLHGHTPGRGPLDANMALHRLLTQLGVDPVAIPHELEERAALWRAETAGRRAVVLLDNAATVQQVRPLLPGGGSCSVVITSRRRLVGLEGAEILSMRVMTVPDAVELFDRIAGLDRTAGERDAVVEAVGLCGFLPLAIDYFLQAHALTMIGDTRLAMGEPSVAKDLWQQALVILDNLAHRDAAGVRERLRALES